MHSLTDDIPHLWWFVEHPTYYIPAAICLIYLPLNFRKWLEAGKRKSVSDRIYSGQLWKGNLAWVAVLLCPPWSMYSGPEHSSAPSFYVLLGLWYLCSAWPMRRVARQRDPAWFHRKQAKLIRPVLAKRRVPPKKVEAEAEASQVMSVPNKTLAVRLGVAAAVLAFLFPPFHFRGAYGHSTGFHFIFRPGYGTGDVDVTLLFIELVIIAATTWTAARPRP